MLKKTHLFEARSNGYYTCRVPGILCAKSGALLATAEARPGTGGDWDGNDILMRRSEDGGKNWLDTQVIIDSKQYGEGPASNFSMISDETDGSVHALYCHNYARVFHIRSTDDGASWSEPREITEAFLPLCEHYPWRVVATGPGHGIQLKNGRFVVPFWMSDGSGTEFGAGKLGHRPSEVGSVYSDDRGQTWQCGEVVVGTGGDIVNPSETLPLELEDGQVLFNI